jgi:hypothetical protein
VEEGSDSANDLEHDKDSAVLKRAKELLSKKQTPDEKPEVTKRDSNIWTSHINPELLDSINRARKVLK